MRLIERVRRSWILPLVVVASSGLWGAPTRAQETPPRPGAPAGGGGAQQPTKPERTEAERIIGLRRLLAADQQQRDALEKEQGSL